MEEARLIADDELCVAKGLLVSIKLLADCFLLFHVSVGNMALLCCESSVEAVEATEQLRFAAVSLSGMEDVTVVARLANSWVEMV